MQGRTVAHYKVLEALGAGGMGVVYKAEDTRLGRHVALKFLSEACTKDSVTLQRFFLEARAISSVNHPNICIIHDINEFEGRPYIVMEHLEGRTLHSIIADGPMSVDRILDISPGILDGMAAAHAKGIIHRDVKPANILVTFEGRAKILDFGLAKLKDAAHVIGDTPMTTPGTTLGTLSYMSPEQIRGEPVDPRTDVYSFGAVLYEMATGGKAFDAAGGKNIVAILKNPPREPTELRPDLPVALSFTIKRALSKRKEDRQQSASEMRSEIECLKPTAGSSAALSAEPTAAMQVQSRSLAILPFRNDDGDPEAEYLCEGISDGLINNLAQVPGLRVMARSSVSRYKGEDLEPKEVGDELSVEKVLVGSVSLRSASIIITAELIDVGGGWQEWGGRYDRRLDDLPAIQHEMTREITRQLRLKLSGEQEERLDRRESVDPRANKAYLTGRFHWSRWTPDGFRKAIEYYEDATRIDPKCALAFAGLADSYSLLGLYALLPPEEAFPKAKDAALKALDVDDSLAEAHTSLAIARFFFEWDWPAARGDLQSAVDLNPGYESSHHIFSTAFSALGRHEEAMQEAQRALELSPLSLAAILNVGWVNFHARNYEASIEQCRTALELEPGFLRAHELLALSCAQQGLMAEAAEEARKVFTDNDGSPRSLAVSGYVFALAGQKAEARNTVAALRQSSATRYVPSLSIAFVSAALDKYDTAFEWLERAYDERDSLLVWLQVEPRLDKLRSDSRFEDIVERVGLRLWGKP